MEKGLVEGEDGVVGRTFEIVPLGARFENLTQHFRTRTNQRREDYKQLGARLWLWT